MSSEATPRPFRDRMIGDIAAELPGATALFRAAHIDFCCDGDVLLGEAARARGLDVREFEASLAALVPDAAATPSGPSDALVEHILRRYHETHRRELTELVRLARKVEAVHAAHPEAPRGLADELEALRLDLDEHMRKEEQVLFPLMLAGGQPMVVHPIEQMRGEHRNHGAQLVRLEEIGRDFVAPAEACRSWQALYAGTARFVEDLREHIHLENNVLFPRFGGACAI